MTIPLIVERAIIVATKPSGLKQYGITLPKEYAERLEVEGIRKLFIIYNRGLAAFPDMGPDTEAAVLEFLKAHPALMKTFAVLKEGSIND